MPAAPRLIAASLLAAQRLRSREPKIPRWLPPRSTCSPPAGLRTGLWRIARAGLAPPVPPVLSDRDQASPTPSQRNSHPLTDADARDNTMRIWQYVLADAAIPGRREPPLQHLAPPDPPPDNQVIGKATIPSKRHRFLATYQSPDSFFSGAFGEATRWSIFRLRGLQLAGWLRAS
jgi:hypothetical protein